MMKKQSKNQEFRSTSFPFLFQMARALRSLVLYVMISSIGISSQEGEQFVYYDFTKANLSLDGMAANLSNGLLQLTNNTTQKTGHAFYRVPIEFNTSAGTLSFSTEFAFALVPEAESRGQGMAFVVSPTTDFRYAGPTSYLGLVNVTHNNKTENHILAIELDTNRSPEAADKSDNHVGIDVNSMYSIEYANASYFNDTEGKNNSLLLASGRSILIWIEYDGVEKLLNVTLAPVPLTKPGSPFLSRSIKPSLPLLSKSINLSEIFMERMFVGFSGSTGTLTSNQYILGWSFKKGGKAENLDMSKILEPPTPRSSHPPPPSTPPRTERLVIIISTISPIVFLIILGGVLYLYQKKKYEEVLEEWEKDYSPQRLSFRTLYKATKGFKENRVVGAGGFGKVYRGDLPDGTQIAVKRVSHGSEQGMREYVSEIATMGRLGHRNVVQLHGYCRRKGELLLAYEYMENGSVSDYLLHGNILSWSQRVHIVKGVASALHYLHEGWGQIVLHRDIKASNVLLDANLNGKLGDFGLARFHDRGVALEATRVVGTIGYMAPELTAMGLATTGTDVYAFGAFMLEVICGRRPVDPDRPREQMILVKWVASCGSRGALMDTIDSELAGNFEDEEAKLILKLGMMCSQSNPENRPSMRDIIQYLEGNGSAPEISFDADDFGNNMAATKTTASSSANYTLDTVTVLFYGR